MEHSQSSKKYQEGYQGEPGKCCQAAMTSACNPCQPPSTTSTVPDRRSAKGHHSLPIKSLHRGSTLKGWVFFQFTRMHPDYLKSNVEYAIHLFIWTKYSTFQMDSFLLALLWSLLHFCLFSPEFVKRMKAPILMSRSSSPHCGLLPDAFGLHPLSQLFLQATFEVYIISEFLSKESVVVGVNQMRKLVAN